MSTVVRTIGIAVTTSIADMLGRTVAHSVYLRGKSEHPARVVGTSSTPNDDDAMEINNAADKDKAANAIRPDLATHEAAYIEALDRFVEATTGFAESPSGALRAERHHQHA